VDLVVLRRDAHHLGAAPGDRTHIGVLLAVLLQHQALGGVDLGDAVGNLEVERLRRFLQPLGMLGALEDFAAIGALALEHRARIVQAVRADVQRGFRPLDELAVVPNDAVEAVIGLLGHRVPPSGTRTGAPAAPHIQAFLYAFASRANTRYDSAAHESAPAAPAQRSIGRRRPTAGLWALDAAG
jgi:hypothetical protein